VILENSLGDDGDVVWARYLPERNEEIIAAFPDARSTWPPGRSRR
jgi:hypothetical protein